MKTIMKGIALAAITAGVATSTFAAKNGLYVGGQLGYSDTGYSASNQQLDKATFTTIFGNSSTTVKAPAGSAKVKTDENHLGGRAYLGYQFNKFFALESGYTGFGKTDFKNIYGQQGKNTSIDEQAVDLVAKGMLPVGHKFGLFAKGGVAYAMADTVSDPATFTANLNNGTTTYHFKKDTTGKFLPTAAVGAEYSITDNLTTDVSYSIIPGSGDIQTAQLFSVGLAYHI